MNYRILFAFIAGLAVASCHEEEPIIRDPNYPPSIVNAVVVPPLIANDGGIATITFDLVDVNEDYTTWSASVQSGKGGKLDATSGGPLRAGSQVVIHFRAGEPTHALITISATDNFGNQAIPVSVKVRVGIS